MSRHAKILTVGIHRSISRIKIWAYRQHRAKRQFLEVAYIYICNNLYEYSCTFLRWFVKRWTSSPETSPIWVTMQKPFLLPLAGLLCRVPPCYGGLMPKTSLFDQNLYAISDAYQVFNSLWQRCPYADRAALTFFGSA